MSQIDPQYKSSSDEYSNLLFVQVIDSQVQELVVQLQNQME